MSDNNPQETYLYEVIVATGMRRNAGTDSKVYLCLMLAREVFCYDFLTSSIIKVIKRTWFRHYVRVVIAFNTHLL